jgi:hypothetical protein
MTQYYFLNKILGLDPNGASNKSAHAVHFVTYKKGEKEIPIVYKENKHGKALASIRETAFSELARLVMVRHLTPPQHLVVDETGKVVGTAVDNISLSIMQREQAGTKFYDASKYQHNRPINTDTLLPGKEGEFKFLNQMPGGFFAHLMREKDKENLSIDMESLASVLTGAYTLEEDDLHKGNIGFYIIEKEGKPHVVFFKIDHDLLLMESIMSFFDVRIQNWLHKGDPFKITERDLRFFPDLIDSQNYYWPTQRRNAVKYGDDKVYSSYEDREAFKGLKHDSEFERYKWKQLLKSALIPDMLIRESLSLHLDRYKDLSEINLISQTMTERTSKLKSVLFSMPEFHFYLNSADGAQDIGDVLKEIEEQIAELIPDVERKELRTYLSTAAREQADLFRIMANPLDNDYFVAVFDSPLHASIRLGDYRFEKADKEFINESNGEGDYPIDVAADMARAYIPGSENMCPGRDPLLTIKDLLLSGAKMTPKVEQVLKDKQITDIYKYEFNSQYLKWSVDNYSNLTDVIAAIGSDNRLTLKTQKIIATKVIKASIHTLTK